VKKYRVTILFVFKLLFYALSRPFAKTVCRGDIAFQPSVQYRARKQAVETERDRLSILGTVPRA
jgi:hypothetical protein